MIETPLAQFSIFALCAYICEIINEFYVDDRTRVATQIVDNFVSSKIVYQDISIGKSGYEQLSVVIECGTEGRNILFHWQCSLELSRFNVVKQQATLVTFRDRTDKRRFRRIAQ